MLLSSDTAMGIIKSIGGEHISFADTSFLHFPSTEVYRKRIIQLGENPERVFNVGALGLDNIRKTPIKVAQNYCKRSDKFAISRQFNMLMHLSEILPAIFLDTSVENNIEFLSTPFDIWGVPFLTEECNVSKIKISSGEVTNTPPLLEAARTQKPIILSTGMCTLRDIKNALGIIAVSYLNEKNPKNVEECFKVYNTVEEQNILREKDSFLHCTTEYPAPFSGNQRGNHSGAEIIEKHFTLDKNLPSPYHETSLESSELN